MQKLSANAGVKLEWGQGDKSTGKELTKEVVRIRTTIHVVRQVLTWKKKKEGEWRGGSRKIKKMVHCCDVHVCFVQVTILKLVWCSRRADSPGAFTFLLIFVL